MKTIIKETDGFRYIMEVRACAHPAGYQQLRFLTEWDQARRDGSEQVQFELILSPMELATLKELL